MLPQAALPFAAVPAERHALVTAAFAAATRGCSTCAVTTILSRYCCWALCMGVRMEVGIGWMHVRIVMHMRMRTMPRSRCV